MTASPWGRRGVLLVIAAAAAVAVLAGLSRMGVAVPGGGVRAGEHGPLLVVGVFVTVIALERAVALAHPAAWLAPLAGAATAIALVLGRVAPARGAAVIAAVALVAVNVAIVRRQRAAFTAIMLLGAVVLVAAAIAWARGAWVFAVVPGWIGFFALTIVAERIELSRLAPTPRWARRLIVVVAVALASLAIAAIDRGPAWQRGLGLAIAAAAAWTLRFDLAWRTIRRPGLPRFAAVGVLAGAAWLLLGGLGLVAVGLPPAGPRYDAIVHAILVGFVLSMVFAHAPIILPAVARIEVPFTRALYAPLALLHGGLGLRIVGDLAGAAALRRGGAIATAVALLGFAATVVVARISTPRRG
ncbi:MAG: hypothetical protein IPL61_31585 [Myxococcales bacterium]|nr:hypothetical protein [Myxococcales bacterium]